VIRLRSWNYELKEFFGMQIISQLHSRDHEVRILSRQALIVDKGTRLFQGDLLNKTILEDFLLGADCLFHCAGEKQNSEKMYVTNVEGTKNLYNIALENELKYFCLISSAGVVGKTKEQWVDEDCKCNPQNEYERTKYEAEKIVSQKIPNCSTIILRPINVIDDHNPGVFGLPIRNTLKDKLHIYLKGAESAHMVHASHIAECATFFMDKVLEYPEVFFVGVDEDESNTYRGIWNKVHSLSGNNHSKLKWNMPIWFPHIVRNLKGIKSNPGFIKYSSNKLNSYGFKHEWDINRMAKIFVLEKILGDGSELGLNLAYAIQPSPDGLAQAFLIGESFLAGAPAALVLGDNLLFGQDFTQLLAQADARACGATVFGYRVKNPSAFGVVEFDENRRVLSIEEKPSQPKSHYAVPGIYFYDERVCELARSLKPSLRGELEITDLNRLYLQQGGLYMELFGRGTAWLDMGTHESLHRAAVYVESIQAIQGYQIANLEEIAFRKGWISIGKLRHVLATQGQSSYSQYLREILLDPGHKNPNICAE
jgi:glucose-1-phosphate thymidylyltransferase